MRARTHRCPECNGRSSGTCPTCAAQLGDGEELTSSARRRLEHGFGDRLPGDLRVHTGTSARAIADREGVRAFAVGHDIGFATGEYRPDTLDGAAILAHEVAHTMQSDLGGSPRNDAGHEADADRSSAAAVGRMLGGTGPAVRPSRGSGLALHGCGKKGPKVAPGQGLDTGLAPGQDSKTYTLDEYIKLWEKQQGRKMTDEEKQRLAKGCVGVTNANLGGGLKHNECFTSLEKAKRRRDELADSTGVKPYIFSKRFWTMGRPFPADASGKVDMSNDDASHPPGEVNFDYGWYDEKSDTWWHANHCDPVTGSDRCRQSYDPSERMEVHQSTLEHYSDPNYFGADKQVFCVAFSKLE